MEVQCSTLLYFHCIIFLDLHVPVCKEEVSPEEEWSSSLVQEESELPQIKEEQGEELLQRPEEAGGSTTLIFL